MPTALKGKEVAEGERALSLEDHPCFNVEARRRYARIHLPVAPRCNAQCKFCNRKYSCVNESRPGVTASVMTPAEALEHLSLNLRRNPDISVVGIAGPGDPFANPEETLETLHLVRGGFPELMLCVSTNGLAILPYVDTLKELRVSHVTITVNAVDECIGGKVYEWLSWDEERHSGPGAARHLWEIQRRAIEALDARRIVVKVNTVYIPGVNSSHVEEISRSVAALGASIHNIIPLLPTAGTAFADIPEPSSEDMKSIRSLARRYIPQMEHCMRCRADAVGFLGEQGIGEQAQSPRFLPLERRASFLDAHGSYSP